MKRMILVMALAAALALCLSACGCDHEWSEATCTTPKTCSLCQATEGEALTHQWEDPTCTTPQTCKRCGATEGEPYGHHYDQGDSEPDYIAATWTVTQTCKICQNVNVEQQPMTAVHNGSAMMISATEFCTRLENVLVNMVQDIRADGVDLRSEYLCFIDENPPDDGVRVYLSRRDDGDNNKITVPGFVEVRRVNDNVNETISYSQKDMHGTSNSFRAFINREDAYYLIMGMIMTLDPTTDYSTAQTIYDELASDGFAEANDLAYICLVDTSNSDRLIIAAYIPE